MLSTRKLIALILALGPLAVLPAAAQPNSGKPVRLIVPFAPGGTLDIFARVIGKELAPMVGAPVVVINRPGASGAIGAEDVAHATPDGSTLMIMTNTLATLPALRNDLPFNIEKDLAPIIELGSTPTVMTLHPSFPARTVKEFIEAAKKMPQGVDFTSPAVGSSPHLAGELFAKLTAVKLVHVPYRGSGPAAAALVAGQIKVMMAPLNLVMPFIKSKQLIPLAVTSAARTPLLPNVPTLQEAGVPNMKPMSQWLGIMTTAGTPPDVISKYNHEIAQILEMPSVRATLEKQMFVISTSSPKKFAEDLQQEIKDVGALIKDANIKSQ
jgi:tripartite-type tricarboxylate transporter receptor subunit TctC